MTDCVIALLLLLVCLAGSGRRRWHCRYFM